MQKIIYLKSNLYSPNREFGFEDGIVVFAHHNKYISVHYRHPYHFFSRLATCPVLTEPSSKKTLLLSKESMSEFINAKDELTNQTSSKDLAPISTPYGLTTRFAHLSIQYFMGQLTSGCLKK